MRIPASITLSRAGALGTLIGAALLVGTVAASATSTPVAPTADGSSYPAVYISAMRDAFAASSFHEHTTVTSLGFDTALNEDAVVNGGVESEQLHSASATFGFTARLFNSRLYLQGDQLTLVDIVGLSTFNGGFDAGKWILVPQTVKAFTELSYGIDVETGIDQIELAPPLSVSSPTTYQGHRVVAITSTVGLHASPTNGAQTGQFTLYVTTGSHPFPVAELAKDKSGTVTQSVTLALSRWNDRVAVSEPRHSIPLP